MAWIHAGIVCVCVCSGGGLLTCLETTRINSPPTPHPAAAISTPTYPLQRLTYGGHIHRNGAFSFPIHHRLGDIHDAVVSMTTRFTNRGLSPAF